MSAAESMPPQTAREWALAYARMGWSVVPVRPGEKLPAVPWAKFQTLPADASTLLGWFDHAPALGVGLVQGRNAGTIVLDFDGELGMATLRELERRGLPHSVRALTPGGGVHVYLRHPGTPIATRKQVLPGMDVRGDGGFVVAPPSVHHTGRPYAWDVDHHPEDVPIADCPDWLLPALHAPVEGAAHLAEVTRATGPLGLQGAVADGREAYMRDTVLAVLTDLHGKLGRLPTEAELIEAAWPQYARNVDFSRPGRGPDEFAAKVRYTLRRAAAGQIRGFEASQDAGNAAPENGATYGAGYDAGSGAAFQEAPKSSLPLIYFNDVAANLDTADFVEGLLTERAMSVVYGDSNAGKTFWVTDLAIHVATGRKWRDREIEAGGVIYCALEGRDGISNRIAAFKAEHGLAGVEVPFAIIPVPINLLDPEADREKLVAAVRIAADHMGVPVKLVVIDTLARALAGGNENAPEDMGALVNSADFIRQEVAAHVLFIHHSGKDQAKGARGHSSLRAATDTEIEVVRPEGAEIGTVKVTKQRDLPKGDTFLFKLRVVELGTNRRGKPVTSCVVDAADEGAEAPQAAPRLSAGAFAARTALSEALAKAGQPAGHPDVPANVPVVPLDAWRREFYARSPLEGSEARKKAFQRASRDLIAARAAVVMHDLAWLCRE